MKEFQLELSYLSGGELKTYTGGGNFEDGFEAAEDGFLISASGKESKTVVKFTPEAGVTLKSFNVTVRGKYEGTDRIFCNGYQSWTDTREFLPGEKMRGIGRFCDLFAGPTNSCRSYGDYGWIDYPNRAGFLHSHNYTYIARGGEIIFTGSLNEKTGYTVFEHKVPFSTCKIVKDVDGAKVAAGKTYALLELVEMTGKYDEIFDKYFALLNIKKPRREFASGFTSWYNYYGNITEQIILENVENIKKGGYGMEIFQIDDGHQSEIGDWLITNSEKFPNGMKFCADKIREAKMTPGIWLAPLACVPASKVMKEHPDWVVKDADGNPIKSGNNWGGFYTLDIYNKDAAAYIKNFFKVILQDWGYQMVKLDFLYEQCIQPRGGKSRGELMDDALAFIRECVGDKLILGCGVPLFPAFGKVDFCRVTCDADPWAWDGTIAGRQMHRENVYTKRAIFTSIYRRHLNGRAFVNDPDVFFLRKTGDRMKLTPEQQEMLAQINHMFGDLIFISDNVGTYDEGQSAKMKEMAKPWTGEILSVFNPKPYIVNIKYREGGEEKEMILDLYKGKFIKR